MFALFFSLYLAMFTGTWTSFSWNDIFNPTVYIGERLRNSVNTLGTFLTSIFNNVDTPMTDLGNNLLASGSIITLVAFVLALITSIGIVVMAVKGIKRVFGVFFMGIR